MKKEKGIQLTAWQPGACSTGGHAYGYASPNGEGLNNQTIQRENQEIQRRRATKKNRISSNGRTAARRVDDPRKQISENEAHWQCYKAANT